MTIPPDGIFDVQDNTYTDGMGRTVSHVHAFSQCLGRPCVIHAPSDHLMRSFPTNLRVPGPFDIKPLHMERICPHGIGHPDPDDAAYQRSIGHDVGVHGCDGCCRDGLISELDEELRPAFKTKHTGADVLADANLAATAMCRSVQDDLAEADADIIELKARINDLERAYSTMQTSRNFWRSMANDALDRIKHENG